MTIYDIWGPASQTLQGADILSASLSALVIVPDLLAGKYAQDQWIAGATPEAQAQKAEFWKTLSFDKHGPVIKKVVDEAGAKYPAVAKLAAFGLCWGGKMTALSSAEGTPFVVSGQAHPGGPTKEDAEAIVIPHICLAAPDDNKAGGIDAYEEVFGKEAKIGVVETYDGMFHGWMGARAKLEEEKYRKEYERG